MAKTPAAKKPAAKKAPTAEKVLVEEPEREVATQVTEAPASLGEDVTSVAQAKLVQSREYGEAVRRSTRESHLKRRAAQHESLANPSGGR